MLIRNIKPHSSGRSSAALDVHMGEKTTPDSSQRRHAWGSLVCMRYWPTPGSGEPPLNLVHKAKGGDSTPGDWGRSWGSNLSRQDAPPSAPIRPCCARSKSVPRKRRMQLVSFEKAGRCRYPAAATSYLGSTFRCMVGLQFHSAETIVKSSSPNSAVRLRFFTLDYLHGIKSCLVMVFVMQMSNGPTLVAILRR